MPFSGHRLINALYRPGTQNLTKIRHFVSHLRYIVKIPCFSYIRPLFCYAVSAPAPLFLQATMDDINRRQIWAVTGPAEGLGPAVIRYLLARGRLVIALPFGDTRSVSLTAPNLEIARLTVTADIVSCPPLQRLTRQYGPIDMLVDNYKSLPVLQCILPYMRAGQGRIILTPPFSGYDQEVAAQLRPLGLSQTISTYLCLDD